jgi:hypothetical protein
MNNYPDFVLDNSKSLILVSTFSSGTLTLFRRLRDGVCRVETSLCLGQMEGAET